MLCTSLWFFYMWLSVVVVFFLVIHEAALSKRLEVQIELLNNYGEHQNWRILNCFIHFFIFSFKKPKTMQRKHTIQFQKLQRKRWIKWYKKGFLFYFDFQLTVILENSNYSRQCAYSIDFNFCFFFKFKYRWSVTIGKGCWASKTVLSSTLNRG